MTTKMNGKPIEQFWLCDGKPGLLGNELSAHLSATYHGDRDEFWVVVTKDWEELERHNARHILSIVWSKP